MVGLDPERGDLRWRHDLDASNWTAPVWDGHSRLFWSKGEGWAVQLRRQGQQTVVENLWSNPRIRSLHSNSVIAGGWIFGTSGGPGRAKLFAADAATGEIAWQAGGFTKSTILYADKKLLDLGEEGELRLLEASGDEVSILAETTTPLERHAWTAPALVDGVLYLRDRRKIAALQLGTASR